MFPVWHRWRCQTIPDDANYRASEMNRRSRAVQGGERGGIRDGEIRVWVPEDLTGVCRSGLPDKLGDLRRFFSQSMQ